MFERFTNRVRMSLALAQGEARGLGHNWLGTEHELLGLLALGDGVAYHVLTDAGISYTDVRRRVTAAVGGGGEPDIDASALAAIGIDLDEVRRCVEESFGPGALDRALEVEPTKPSHLLDPRRLGRGHPFTPRAKRVLELAL